MYISFVENLVQFSLNSLHWYKKEIFFFHTFTFNIIIKIIILFNIKYILHYRK